jgi:competence protein ComEA
MFYSLIIKLGMFAATMGVVFWIGWTLPASFDRSRDSDVNSSEEAQAEVASGGEGVVVADQKRSPNGLLDLNRATDQDFDALPGIGPKLAERIMAYRQSVGAFHSLDELRSVKGIGEKTFKRIRPLVTVTTDAGPIGGGKKAT